VRPPLEALWLGTVAYADAARLQERLVAARRRGENPDMLLLLEHPSTITLGRGADPRHVLLDRDALRRRGIELHECGRGGDVTWHGPGQLVGYPIVGLDGAERDAHRYLRTLESALIAAVARWGVAAERASGRTGIWVGQEKLAAIGVRLHTGWITSHGFALNVAPDLSGFDAIVPCGIRDRGVTSLERLIGRAPATAEVAAVAAARLAEALGRRLRYEPAGPALLSCTAEGPR
jgi:lipoyl(octanoyl) transferase